MRARPAHPCGMFACENMTAGCEFTGAMAEVEAHELRCLFSAGSNFIDGNGSDAAAAAEEDGGGRQARTSSRQTERTEEVGTPPAPAAAAAKIPPPRQPRTPPRTVSPPAQQLSSLRPSPSREGLAAALREMPENTATGINIAGVCYDVSSPPRFSTRGGLSRSSSSASSSSSLRDDVTVEFTDPGPIGIDWEALWPDEMLAVFTTQKLGIGWGSKTGIHVEDHSHVVVMELSPGGAEEGGAEEARAQGIKPGCHLVRIGEEKCAEHHFNKVLEIIAQAPRPLRLVLGHPLALSLRRRSADCVVWNIEDSAKAVLNGQVRPGMVLAAVNGVSIRGKRVEEVNTEIAEAQRPVRLTFRERRVVRRSSRSVSSSSSARTPSSSRQAPLTPSSPRQARSGGTPPRTPRSPSARNGNGVEEGLPPVPSRSSSHAHEPEPEPEPYAVPTVLLPEDHRVLWEGWLHRSDERRLFFRAYQAQGEQYCRIAHSPVAPALGDTASVVTAQADRAAAAPPSPAWSDGSALTFLSAPTAASPEQFGLGTVDGGEYELSAGDEQVALEVATRLRGLVMSAADKAAVAAGFGSSGLVSDAPPIIPVAAVRAAGAKQTTSASSGVPLLWIAAVVLVGASIWIGDLSDLTGASPSGPPACATEMSCGEHGSVVVYSSADRGEYCKCDCDDGFTGEDCTTEASKETYEIVSDWFGGLMEPLKEAHRKLHETLAKVAAGS